MDKKKEDNQRYNGKGELELEHGEWLIGEPGDEIRLRGMAMTALVLLFEAYPDLELCNLFYSEFDMRPDKDKFGILINIAVTAKDNLYDFIAVICDKDGFAYFASRGIYTASQMFEFYLDDRYDLLNSQSIDVHGIHGKHKKRTEKYREDMRNPEIAKINDSVLN